MTLRDAFVLASSGGGGISQTTSTMPDHVSQLIAAGSTYDPAVASGTGALTAGVMTLVKFRAYASTMSKVMCRVTTAQVGATSVFVGIYKADGTQNSDMATATVDAVAAFGATGTKAIALTNAVALAVGADYYVAFLVTGAPSTAPILRASSAGSDANVSLTAAQGLRSGTSGAGLAALPASVTLATMTAVAIMPYAVVS